MARLLPLAPLVLACAGLLACAAPCEKVASSHTAFRKASVPLGANASAAARQVQPDGRPHASISIPFELIDVMVARELGRVPVVEVPLPAFEGVSLGRLRLGVEAVRMRQAPAGELGVRVVVGLREGTRRVFSVDVDARVRPHLDPRGGTLSLRLAGEDIIELRPSVSAASKRQLGDWLWSKLPEAARMLLDRSTIVELAGGLIEQLSRDAVRELKGELLTSLGQLVHLELDLPEELPLDNLALRTGERELELELHTALQVEHGLAPPSAPRVAGIHPNMIQVRLSGDTAAALVNNAIREGRIPSRWSLEGEPDPAGELYAGMGWAEGRTDSLELHLWKTEGDCAHVVLRGEPHLELRGRELELGTERATVESVTGSAKLRAGLFFSRTARRGVELVERTTAATQIELGRATMDASVAAATVSGDEIVLGLRLSQARAGGRP